MTDTFPVVCQDANRHTCIAISQGRRYIHYIPCGDYAVKHELISEFWRYRTVLQYDIAEAAKKFLQHASLFGATEKARDILQNLATGVPAMSNTTHTATPAAAEVWPPTAQAKADRAKTDGKKAAKAPAKSDGKKAAKAPTKAAAKPAAKKAPANGGDGGKGRSSPFAGKSIEPTAKGKEILSGLREGSKRRALMEAIFKAKSVDKVLGTDVDGKGTTVRSIDLHFAAEELGIVKIK